MARFITDTSGAKAEEKALEEMANLGHRMTEGPFPWDSGAEGIPNVGQVTQKTAVCGLCGASLNLSVFSNPEEGKKYSFGFSEAKCPGEGYDAIWKRRVRSYRP